jgi:predicted RNase H-like nuclease (RuvC/YqgF family)
MDQPDYVQRRQIAETRETVDRILAKNASLTRENDSLHVTNRQLKSEITALSEKVESLSRTQMLLSRKVLFLMKTTDETSRKSFLAEMGIADQEIDLDAYTQSLSLEIRNIMDINRAITRHVITYGSIPDEAEDRKSNVSLSDSVIAGLHFGEDSNE